MTTRRETLIAIGASLVAWPLAIRAQQKSRIPHIGYMSTGSVRSNGAFLDAFKSGLHELGYVDGKNIVIDVRWAGDSPTDFPQIAASLVKDQPSAIIGTCVPSTRAAKDATRSIPIVMAVDGDPVAAGLIASFARPGGNVTGASTLFEELIPKWIELITTAVPRVRTLGLLRDPVNVVDPFYVAQFEEAAKRVGVSVVQFEARAPEDFDRAFREMKRQDAGGLVVLTEAYLAGEVERIVPLALQYRLASIYGFREFAEAGGMMSYGVSFRDYYKRVARYVDAVLKGTKPADLPVEQPTRIELVINLATARKLGVSMPPQLLARADRVIE
jgi:putative tryptophan/tyrosine transport system substrate-binding protein